MIPDIIWLENKINYEFDRYFIEEILPLKKYIYGIHVSEKIITMVIFFLVIFLPVSAILYFILSIFIFSYNFVHILITIINVLVILPIVFLIISYILNANSNYGEIQSVARKKLFLFLNDKFESDKEQNINSELNNYLQTLNIINSVYSYNSLKVKTIYSGEYINNYIDIADVSFIEKENYDEDEELYSFWGWKF